MADAWVEDECVLDVHARGSASGGGGDTHALSHEKRHIG